MGLLGAARALPTKPERHRTFRTTYDFHFMQCCHLEAVIGKTGQHAGVPAASGAESMAELLLRTARGAAPCTEFMQQWFFTAGSLSPPRGMRSPPMFICLSQVSNRLNCLRPSLSNGLLHKCPNSPNQQGTSCSPQGHSTAHTPQTSSADRIHIQVPPHPPAAADHLAAGGLTSVTRCIPCLQPCPRCPIAALFLWDREHLAELRTR